jgi:hypothetical protein
MSNEWPTGHRTRWACCFFSEAMFAAILLRAAPMPDVCRASYRALLNSGLTILLA